MPDITDDNMQDEDIDLDRDLDDHEMEEKDLSEDNQE